MPNITPTLKYAVEAPLADMSIAEMVEAHNLIVADIDRPGDQVKSFRDRTTAERRLKSVRTEWVPATDTSPGLARLRKAAGSEALRQQVVADQDRARTVAIGTRTVPRDPPADYPAPRGRGQRSSFTGEETIVILSSKNPKRQGTQAARIWGKYRAGMTVDQFVTAVGDRRLALSSLHWDIAHGLIKVKQGS